MNIVLEDISHKITQDIFKNDKVLEGLLPDTKKFHISFEVKENTSIANAIRRTLKAELPSKSLNVDVNNIECDDILIIPDAVKINIQAIPLFQDCTESFTLDVKNTTTALLDVYSDQIKSESKKKWFSQRIKLFTLNIGRSCSIKNIFIETKNRNGLYSMVSSVEYKQLDIEPFNERTGTGHKSITCIPQHYRIGYTVNGNIDPKKVMVLVCENLIERLKNIYNDVKKISESKEIDLTNEHVIIYPTIHNVEYKLLNETRTIGKMLEMCIYEEKTDIHQINYRIDHPESTYSFLRFKTSDDTNKLIMGCITRLIKKFENIKANFEK